MLEHKSSGWGFRDWLFLPPFSATKKYGRKVSKIKPHIGPLVLHMIVVTFAFVNQKRQGRPGLMHRSFFEEKTKR